MAGFRLEGSVIIGVQLTVTHLSLGDLDHLACVLVQEEGASIAA